MYFVLARTVSTLNIQFEKSSGLAVWAEAWRFVGINVSFAPLFSFCQILQNIYSDSLQIA